MVEHDIIDRMFAEMGEQPKVLSREEEAELFQRYEQGDRTAYELLIKHNIRLVFSIARRYTVGLTIEEAFQEGVLGLNRAIEKFDWRKGFKFSTYATNWIQQFITRATANQADMIRLPVHIWSEVMRMGSVLKEEPEATDERIAEVTGFELEVVKKYKHLTRTQPLYYDGLKRDSDGTVDVFEVPDENTRTDAELEEKDSINRVHELLGTVLDEREIMVVCSRFGIGDDTDGRTLDEVGRQIGVTRERIRQIEKNAFEKLRESEHAEELLSLV